MSIEYSTLFTDLDCLLDTRLATLHSFGKEAFDKTFTDEYFSRLNDIFKDIDNFEFEERYKNRNNSILEHSLSTHIRDVVIDFVKKTVSQPLEGSAYILKPKIIINTHPYSPSEDTINNIIKIFIKLTNEEADIQIVSMSINDITPKYVKDNLSILILYDYTNWLEHHHEAFKKTTCPEVSLLGPKIFFKEVDLSKINQTIDPFESVEFITAPFISLHLLPINMFSIKLKNIPT